MPSQVLTEGARMLRFLTPTEAWRGRVASKVSLPGEWPVMLVEIFHADDGKVSMGIGCRDAPSSTCSMPRSPGREWPSAPSLPYPTTVPPERGPMPRADTGGLTSAIL